MSYISIFLQVAQLIVLVYIARKEIPRLPFLATASSPPRTGFKPYAKPDNSGKRKPFAHDEQDLYAREVQSRNRN